MFGNINLTALDGFILAAIIAVVEWPIKRWICKSNAKFKALYTAAPIVLSAVTYLVIGLVQKSPVADSLIRGIGIGVASMGSYDAIVTLIKSLGIKDFNELGEAVKEAVEKDE